MCHGDIDPRFLARDIEARMAPVTEPAGQDRKTAVPAASGLAARLAAWFAAVTTKKATHG